MVILYLIWLPRQRFAESNLLSRLTKPREKYAMRAFTTS
jgi:hypothetical protein